MAAKELSQQYAIEDEKLSHDVKHKLVPLPSACDMKPMAVTELFPDDKGFLLHNYLSDSECTFSSNPS
jgi:hypothetical protein